MPHLDPIVVRDEFMPVLSCGQEGEADYPELVLSRLEAISKCLANAEAATVSVTSSAMAELDDLFASLDLESSDSPTRTISMVSPTQWLLDNLHNPYPPCAAKRTIEESPELGGRTVNEWFSKARQRIGWTRLLRDRFGGSRSAATDAAFRAFVRDDQRSPLDPELYAAFMAVKAHANLVYTPSSPCAPGAVSPPSRSPSATPSLTHSTDTEDNDDDASHFSRKRKISWLESPSEPCPTSPARRKRRLELPSERTRSSSHLSSLPITPATDISPSPPRSRKRRLSESEPGGPTDKKSRGLEWGARKQMVSDPLPQSTSFDWESWCTEAFSLPQLASTNHPVPCALDFELFNFEAFPVSRLTDLADSPTGTIPEFTESLDSLLDSFIGASSETKNYPLPNSWDGSFGSEVPCHSPLPSLTNSPSPPTPDTRLSLSPPELQSIEFLRSPLFDFSSSSLFKIPSLYPEGDVDVFNYPLIL